MQNNAIINYFGLMARARKLVTGDTLVEAIRHKKVYLVVIANDAGDNTKKKLIDKCKYYQIDFITLLTSDQISAAIGKTNRKAVGITDRGFTNGLLKKLESR